ncbi:MAG: ImuA family protein [Alphaproteobacteria bacterium]
MNRIRNQRALAGLRDQIRQIEGVGEAAGHPVLPLGIPAIDEALPEGGLPLGGVHEVRGPGAVSGSGAATGFCAALLARLAAQDGRPVLWLSRGEDLYLPGLMRFGLRPGPLLTVSRIAKQADMLWAMEEALRCTALCAVVAEIRDADFTASRRVQLAAETAGVTGFLLSEGTGAGASTALTRWQVRAAPSLPTGLPGVGMPVWQVDLLRCRAGRPGSWSVIWDEGGWSALEPMPRQAALSLVG